MKYETLTLLLTILVLITVTIIDIKHRIIPDIIIYPGIVLLMFIKSLGSIEYLKLSLILALAGFTPFFLIWYFTKGKLGLGDAKYSAFLCLALGLKNWFLMIFISSFSAVIFAVLMLMLKHFDSKTKIPYAPFLSLGAVISFLLV